MHANVVIRERNAPSRDAELRSFVWRAGSTAVMFSSLKACRSDVMTVLLS